MPLSNEQLWEIVSQLASRPRHEKVRVLEYELLRKNDHLMALLRKGDCQKSVEPFSLDASILWLTEKPAKRDTAYLVDMAKVEALDTVGEKEKAVELLERYV